MSILYLEKIASNFQKELDLAERGYKTSLPFIINPIPEQKIIDGNEIFQVMVTGGTIFKSALVQKNKHAIKIVKENKNDLPLFLTKELFLSYITNALEKNVKFLAINFTYGLKPFFRRGILDGSDPIPSKGHLFKGFGNETIGESVEKYIFEKIGKKIRVSVANDTICLLLSSLEKISWNRIAAGIAGTGVNFAFFIDKNKAVNLESASFDKFIQTETGKIIDLKYNKDQDLFEKETSGAYLYKHFNLLIKKRNINHP
ncbi:MAG: hypothetical protein M1324_01625, partial [Patescibacteria group bacterium]|nr:hypothetical protein [Patescibacteria group bacterium]